MKKFISILIVFALLFGGVATVSAVSTDELDRAIESAAEFLLQTVQNPEVGSVGGCWTVLGLARSGINVPDSFFENYFAAAEIHTRLVRGGVVGGGTMQWPRLPITEYSRIILALTAAGFDPQDVENRNLLMEIADFDRVASQGINSVIFALLAFDSLNYSIPTIEDAQTQVTRKLLVDEILRLQLNDGGWNLIAGFIENWQNEVSEADLTAMALQALAKYQDNPNVAAATNRALAFLSSIQLDCGGFLFSGGMAAESVAQVIVALVELGIPLDDERFVKNGNTLLDSLLSFQSPDGGFWRGGENSNLMTTEQAFYALVAAQRLRDGQNSLYRMSDASQRNEIPAAETIGLPNKHRDVTRVEITSPGRTFDDIANHPNRQAIEALAARGIINGRTEIEFTPDETMTRAEFAAIITRGLGLPERVHPILGAISIFDDVPDNLWFTSAVQTAFHYRIVTGVSEVEFNPHGTITRQEAAVMVARAARLCGMDTDMSDGEILNILAKFGDSRAAADWAQASLAFAFREGILDDSEFYIQPEIPILRGEIAEILYRLLERSNLL
ncbi:MAG: S-layer homology domain-containing protein [Oscillospiraceae bacterium]|nr:S-layer homology domain-containing protein [Oscillospiraceae bacterium]